MSITFLYKDGVLVNAEVAGEVPVASPQAAPPKYYMKDRLLVCQIVKVVRFKQEEDGYHGQMTIMLPENERRRLRIVKKTHLSWLERQVGKNEWMQMRVGWCDFDKQFSEFVWSCVLEGKRGSLAAIPRLFVELKDKETFLFEDGLTVRPWTTAEYDNTFLREGMELITWMDCNYDAIGVQHCDIELPRDED